MVSFSRVSCVSVAGMFPSLFSRSPRQAPCLRVLGWNKTGLLFGGANRTPFRVSRQQSLSPDFRADGPGAISRPPFLRVAQSRQLGLPAPGRGASATGQSDRSSRPGLRQTGAGERRPSIGSIRGGIPSSRRLRYPCTRRRSPSRGGRGRPFAAGLGVIKALDMRFCRRGRLGYRARKRSALHHALVGLSAGVVFGGIILGYLYFSSAKQIGAAVLLPRAINEIVFPIGCSLVLYVTEMVAEHYQPESREGAADTHSGSES